MRAIILAAGKGSRLGRFTENNTKCMVEVNGKKLIEYALEAIEEAGIKEVVMVVGYKSENVKKFLGSEYNGLKIKYVENDIYDKTNNIYSLWLAKEFLNDDILLLESDLIFEKNILKRMLKDSRKNLVLVDKYESWMDGTVTLIDENDNIESFVDKSKFDWSMKDNYYKTVNMYKFSKEFLMNSYVPFLEAYIKSQGNNSYYEEVLKVISSLGTVKLEGLKLDCEKWYEIDDAQDLEIASGMFANDDDKLKSYQRRYGGYWRFPKLKDFCYLVNPYFPDGRMLDEMKSSFDTLLAEYPSGLNVQNLLAAKMFSCDKEHILVGNGAAELINALIQNIEGQVGAIYPTFNEYPERVGKERLKKFIPQDENFNYTINELKEFSNGVDCLILINPDNPSGHCFTRAEIIDLIDYLHDNNKKLILDESFIDFAGIDEQFSLIDSIIMEKYENLIVIKSISKSYGVPGCRLGVLATADKELLSKVRKRLSIWNINSFGEFFLQIIGKYQKQYKEGCIKIAEERDRFFNELKGIPYLRVIPSKANYFLCELTNNLSATELTKVLLCNNNIFIKDCTGKEGFNSNKYIRIAVRDREDNDYLISVLKTIKMDVESLDDTYLESAATRK